MRAEQEIKDELKVFERKLVDREIRRKERR